MVEKDISWTKSQSFSESLTHALRGLRLTFKRESNFRRQAVLFVLASILAFILNVPLFHFAVIILVSIIVLVLEIINTAFEALADVAYPEYNEVVRSAKDILAGAVLLASLAALVVGLLVFLPPVAKLVMQGW